MHKLALVLIFSVGLSLAQTQTSSVDGVWVFVIERKGERLNFSRTRLTFEDGKLTGTAPNVSLRGTLKNSAVQLGWFGAGGSREAVLSGKFEAGRFSGTATAPDGLDYTWTAERESVRPPQRTTHTFEPTDFQRYFSGTTPPVLKIYPGDTVRTSSVDAGGTDLKGKRRSPGGNPLTGPFYIEGALPGDTLVVRINRIRTNRDWAQSGTGIVANAVTPNYLANQKRAKDFSGRWHLDAKTNTATPAQPSDALKNFRIPIEPMLGCVAVAPPGQEVISTRDSGRFGGNMDYNRIREGTTVYLPVSKPGALLLVGDGHAAQGDGELTGDALETSMDIEFTVDVVQGKSPSRPYAEDADYLMSIGIAGSLDEALRQATAFLAAYIEQEHGLNSNEAALVLGFAIKYDVADLVGTQVSVVAKLPKSTLAQLPPPKH